jgi:OmpA-OmpF porin, OOP family
MKRRARAVLVLTLALAATAFVPVWAAAQEPEGAKDHPMVPRMPNYQIAEHSFQEFESADFPLPNDKVKTIEGKHWKILYALKEGAKKSSELEILRNYANAFKAKNFKAEYVMEPGEGIFSLKTPASEIWVNVRPAAGDGDSYTIEIVEKAGMAQSIELNASELAKALDANGSVAIRGILFDTGKATITPESEPVLTTIADVLKANAAMRLEIQGHTDNVGQKAANQTLSQQRADAVRQYLVAKSGIAAARLTAVGFGDTKPVAPNTTDDGRAQNRRVELVKK